MNQNAMILPVLFVVVARCSGQYDLLWDSGDWDSWDHAKAVSSERNTEVPESWIVDDFMLAESATLRELRWLAVRLVGFEPEGADFILLTADFVEIVEALDHECTSEFEGIEFGHEVYQLTIPSLDIELVPGRYYIGARYVGDGSGRSWAAGQFTNHGETEAYIRSDFLGYPDWTPNPFRIDSVFQVYGDIIPAPATLALGLPALLACRRRR